MPSLKLSDLFIKRGRTFDGDIRIADQDALLERLKEHADLSDHAQELAEFLAVHGIVQYWWLEEIFFSDLTKTCVKHRIDIV